MAKTTIPQREVEICDFCKRDGLYLTNCWVCDRQFCLTDNGTVPQSWGFTDLCRECSGREDVQAICKRFADELTPIYEQRMVALKELATR